MSHLQAGPAAVRALSPRDGSRQCRWRAHNKRRRMVWRRRGGALALVPPSRGRWGRRTPLTNATLSREPGRLSTARRMGLPSVARTSPSLRDPQLSGSQFIRFLPVKSRDNTKLLYKVGLLNRAMTFRKLLPMNLPATRNKHILLGPNIVNRQPVY